ncbi:MAG: helix-turn-helix domain-containing protein, partial [Polyangia bacterium]|nr:helix-turn-helix domain-containing protein [Polyangia bacterium]
EREFERIGSQETVKVDVRLVSATNRNLEELIAKGLFRRDLYYRLNVFPVLIPPLRERKEDIDDLVRHFIVKFGPDIGKSVDDVHPEALEKLRRYQWPGNVRELENVIERAIILCQGRTITPAELDFGPVAVLAPEDGQEAFGHAWGAAAPPQPHDLPLTERLGAQEREQIVQALERAGGNVAAAARALGINRSTLYYRMRKHALDDLLPGRAPDPPAPQTAASK